MRRVLMVLSLAMLAGCGARTALDRDEPQVDAGVDGGDAGFFVTFPCRWSLGTPLDLARGRGFGELAGAVHPVRRMAAVSARGFDGSHVGARVLLQHSAEHLGDTSGAQGALFTGSNGWLRQLEGGCALVEHDEGWVEGPALRWGGGTACDLAQSEAGRIESAPIGDASGSMYTVRYADEIAEPLAATLAPIERGVVVRDTDRGFVAALEVRGVLNILRVRASGEPEVLEVRDASEVSAAPDRLRAAVLLLFRSAGDGFRLVRIGWDDPLELRDVSDLDRLPAPPIGALASNETEAMIPLADGSMAYVPLTRDEVRITERADEGEIESMEIVLRPGESVGGLIYAVRVPSGEAVLTFRALVCNR